MTVSVSISDSSGGKLSLNTAVSNSGRGREALRGGLQPGAGRERAGDQGPVGGADGAPGGAQDALDGPRLPALPRVGADPHRDGVHVRRQVAVHGLNRAAGAHAWPSAPIPGCAVEIPPRAHGQKGRTPEILRRAPPAPTREAVDRGAARAALRARQDHRPVPDARVPARWCIWPAWWRKSARGCATAWASRGCRSRTGGSSRSRSRSGNTPRGASGAANERRAVAVRHGRGLAPDARRRSLGAGGVRPPLQPPALRGRAEAHAVRGPPARRWCCGPRDGTAIFIWRFFIDLRGEGRDQLRGVPQRGVQAIERADPRGGPAGGPPLAGAAPLHPT